LLEIKDETFEGTFPFAPHYHTISAINNFQMHYVDEGDGEPLVLLHGDPTWGYLYRKFIPPLSQQWRCIVPDQMGMGKSGVPKEPFPYRLEHHISNLEALLLYLDLRDITLVLHDWGGPVGVGFATRHPERIKRLVLLNTWAFATWPGGPFPRLLEIIRSERGEKFVLERNGYVEPALLGTTYHRENLTKEIIRAYLAPFPAPETRLALLCWSRDIPVNESDYSYAEMQRIEQNLSLFNATPVLLAWGLRDPVLSPEILHKWQQIYPQATLCRFEEASHFLQEDAPEQIVGCIVDFLKANP
jgi:haloalkane dehalogenase